MSPEMQTKFAMWRAKNANGELSRADMAEIIRAIRGDRVGAQVASDQSRRKKAKAEIPNADDLLSELDGL